MMQKHPAFVNNSLKFQDQMKAMTWDTDCNKKKI